MSHSSPKSIIHPSLDSWLVGGLSIVVLVGFLALSSVVPQDLILGNFLVLTILVNGTHFMASYFLLYSSKEFIRRYRAAAVYMPIGLLAVGALGLWAASPPLNEPGIIQGIFVITALYLALHYTGQAWGMMASYAYIHGIRFSSVERTTLRTCLRVMAAWQMVWALKTSPSYIPTTFLPWVTPCMRFLDIAAIASFAVGGFTLIALRRRLGIPIPSSIIVPFVSLYVWYCFLSVYPQSIFWVQIFHATQYLSFPFRVEANRMSLGEFESLKANRLRHLLTYSLTLSLASLFVFVGVDKALNYPHGGFETYFLVFVSLINIHHYFIDGCIWHISNPEVRARLFAHVRS